MQDETFEDYLQEYFFENEAEGMPKDVAVDSYEGWVSNLEADEVMELAEKAIKHYKKLWKKETQ